MNRHELPLDGWIIKERVLCHRLESTPRLPAPAACTPLETNEYIQMLSEGELWATDDLARDLSDV